MFKRVDQSSRLSSLIERLSAGLAKRRGLPIVIGVGLIAVSFLIQIVQNLAPAPFWQWAWTITHHVGLLAALIGILLVEPLGQ